MEHHTFERRIQATQQRLDALRQQASAGSESSVAAEAIEELSIALEELMVASEEMCEQNEALAAARQAAEAERQRYLDLFEFAPDGYLVTDENGVIREANRATAVLFNVQRHFLVGKPLVFYVHEPKRREFNVQLTRMKIRTADAEQILEFETLLRPRDGVPFPASITVGVKNSAPNQPLTLRWLLRDVTLSKQSEDALRDSNQRLYAALSELRETQAQLIQQERLRSMGTMASGIAHDFNNALMPVLGYADLLLSFPQHLDNRKKLIECLESIKTCALDAQSVVTRLRQFYRRREREDAFQPVNLNTIIEETVSITQPKWKSETMAKGAVVNVQTDLSDVPPIMGSETELRTLLTNLIFNAVEAMPGGGTIMIRTRMGVWEYGGMGETTPHTPPHAHTPAQVVLEVRDTGTGMTEHVRQRCLEPFFSTKGINWSGLGLSIVYGIVKRHEGSLHVGSAVDRGTRFSITFPAREEAKTADEPTHVGVEVLKRALHVLVVDDDPRARDILGEFLANAGYTIELAHDGREGLEKFQAGAFDLIITDRAMPHGSGDQLAAAIKQTSPQQPVIMVTGFGDLLPDEAERAPVADVVLTKPIQLQELLEAIGKVTGKQFSVGAP